MEVVRLLLGMALASSAAGAAFPSPVFATGKADAVFVDEDGDIPKSPNRSSSSMTSPQEYKTYSFFLIPETWNAAKKSELLALREGFQQFGAAIGHDHLAIWFIKRASDERLDFEKMKRYGRLLLNPVTKYPFELGPYVVLTRQHPDRMKQGDEALILQLKGVSAVRARAILAVLKRDLDGYDAAHPEFSEQALELERVLQILKTSMEENVTELSELVVALLSWR